MGIPAESYKKGEIKPVLPTTHYYCENLIVKQKQISSNLRDAKIIITVKKGDGSDFIKYHDIALLFITGKTLACSILSRLNFLVEEILPKFQCGVRSLRGTIDKTDSCSRSAMNNMEIFAWSA